MGKIPLSARIQLWMVRQWICFLNLSLSLIRKALFFSSSDDPKNILIFKTGNIGDIVCAIPSFVAIRRFYSKATVSLLSSPGGRGMVGAQDFFSDIWYFDRLKIYHTETIQSSEGRKAFLNELRGEAYDLFIQLPDDLVNFRVLVRNMFFAKMLGIKYAFGFKIRTVQLFKKAQVDYATQKTEVEDLLDLLRENGVRSKGVEYDFGNLAMQESAVNKTLKSKWSSLGKNEMIVVINPGGKREANRWPPERFGEIAKYLQENHNAKIIIIGSNDDLDRAGRIESFLDKKNALILAGKLSLLEIVALLKRATFLISNDTGAAHMAAAVGLPVVGLYCVRNVFGRWLPYGANHEIVYHKFIDGCDYRSEECIKKSVEMISVEEVRAACERLIRRLSV